MSCPVLFNVDLMTNLKAYFGSRRICIFPAPTSSREPVSPIKAVGAFDTIPELSCEEAALSVGEDFLTRGVVLFWAAEFGSIIVGNDAIRQGGTIS